MAWALNDDTIDPDPVKPIIRKELVKSGIPPAYKYYLFDTDENRHSVTKEVYEKYFLSPDLLFYVSDDVIAVIKKRIEAEREKEELAAQKAEDDAAKGEAEDAFRHLGTLNKKISVPAIEQDELINSLEYINYYQMVRERVKRSAYRAYTAREQGEITMAFIISSTGQLKAVKLIEEKSAPSKYLRSAADRAIKSAAPFPQFPPELNYAELSFNIAITFEVE